MAVRCRYSSQHHHHQVEIAGLQHSMLSDRGLRPADHRKCENYLLLRTDCLGSYAEAITRKICEGCRMITLSE